MANFVVSNSTGIGGGSSQIATTTTFRSQVVFSNSSNTTSLTGAGLFKRGKVYDFMVGVSTTPADNYYQCRLMAITGLASNYTTACSVSSISSAFGTDPGDGTGYVWASEINSSAEAGITNNTQKIYYAFNQRATYRWVANPGSEIVFAAATGAGLALQTLSGAGVGTVDATVFISE